MKDNIKKFIIIHAFYLINQIKFFYIKIILYSINILRVFGGQDSYPIVL